MRGDKVPGLALRDSYVTSQAARGRRAVVSDNAHAIPRRPPTGGLRRGISSSYTGLGNYFLAHFPTFSFWKLDFLGDARVVLDAPPRPDAPLGLYLYVPFCRKFRARAFVAGVGGVAYDERGRTEWRSPRR